MAGIRRYKKISRVTLIELGEISQEQNGEVLKPGVTARIIELTPEILNWGLGGCSRSSRPPCRETRAPDRLFMKLRFRSFVYTR